MLLLFEPLVVAQCKYAHTLANSGFLFDGSNVTFKSMTRKTECNLSFDNFIYENMCSLFL